MSYWFDIWWKVRELLAHSNSKDTHTRSETDHKYLRKLFVLFSYRLPPSRRMVSVGPKAHPLHRRYGLNGFLYSRLRESLWRFPIAPRIHTAPDTLLNFSATYILQCFTAVGNVLAPIHQIVWIALTYQPDL